jgi:carbamoyltransferase
MNGTATCILEILNLSDAGPRPDRSFFSTERLQSGGFGARFYERLGLADGEPIPEALRAHLAAGIQKAVEAAALRSPRRSKQWPARNLCLAGGLGLNALLVSSLEQALGANNVFVQPVAGNAGTAVGAVLNTWHTVYRQEARVPLRTLSLGPAYSAADTKQVLENCKLRFRYLLTTDEIIDTAVEQLTDNKIVAWMHGRMEFGPRALGNRSILASPLDPYSTENLNIFIKHRESNRKFAASVPAELCAQYFDVGANARYLATVGRVRRNIASSSRRPSWRATWCGCTPWIARRIRCTGNFCTPPGRLPACRCCITLRSIFSASPWSARRATRCAAFTPRASTPCWWEISS